MFQETHAFSGFSVNDLDAAKEFYGKTLGVKIREDALGLMLKPTGGNEVFIYNKPDHVPAAFTILNFVVADIDKTVDELKQNGVEFEQYDGITDEKGIARGIVAQTGPDIAWFKDPAGNILSVLHNQE